MAANKERIMDGVKSMAVGFPLIFLGPGLFFLKGARGLDNGQWWWAVLSFVVMGLAVFYVVRGLRLIMAGFFNDK